MIQFKKFQNYCDRKNVRYLVIDMSGSCKYLFPKFVPVYQDYKRQISCRKSVDLGGYGSREHNLRHGGRRYCHVGHGQRTICACIAASHTPTICFGLIPFNAYAFLPKFRQNKTSEHLSDYPLVIIYLNYLLTPPQLST